MYILAKIYISYFYTFNFNKFTHIFTPYIKMPKDTIHKLTYTNI